MLGEKLAIFALDPKLDLVVVTLVLTSAPVDPLWSTGQETRLPCERSAVRIRLGTHHSRRKLWIDNHVQ